MRESLNSHNEDYSKDMELVARILGDKENIVFKKEIAENYFGFIKTICLRYFPKNQQDLEEAVQDSLLRVHQNLALYQGKGALRAWIGRVTINTCLSLIKLNSTKKVGITRSSLEISHAEEFGSLDSHDGGNESLEQIYIEYMLGLSESEFLKIVPGPKRWIIFNMFYKDGMKGREIAEELGIDDRGVRSALSRTRNLIEKYFIEHRNEI